MKNQHSCDPRADATKILKNGKESKATVLIVKLLIPPTSLT